MSTAFEKIGTDRELQDHWLRRLIAAVIDGIIIGIIASIILALFSLPFVIAGVPLPWWFTNWFAVPAFVLGIFWLLYASFMESARDSTIGKMVMNLRVNTTDGRTLTFDRALIRNVSKIYPLFWLLDVIIGMATPGDPHQKYTDRTAGTTVTPTTTGGMILPTRPSPPSPPAPTKP